jgi:hypothetical protein
VSSGQYVTADFEADHSPWNYRITAPGYEYVDGQVNAEQSSYEIGLYPACLLTGQVCDMYGNAITGYNFTVLDSEGTLLQGLGGVVSSEVYLQYGRFLDSLPLTVQVSKTDYITATFQIPSGSNEDIAHNFTLLPTPGSIIEYWRSTWNITDRLPGAGIGNATLTFTSKEGAQYSASADSNGIADVSLSNIQLPMHVAITASGYEYAETTVIDATVQNYTIQLYPARVLSGHVYDQSGAGCKRL